MYKGFVHPRRIIPDVVRLDATQAENALMAVMAYPVK